MIALERTRQQLIDLGLTKAAQLLDSSLEAASQKDLTYADSLVDLLDGVLAARRAGTSPPGHVLHTHPLRRPWTSSTSRSNLPSTTGLPGSDQGQGGIGGQVREKELPAAEADLMDLNREALGWCEEVSHRIHGTTNENPVDRFKEEKLNPLPRPEVLARHTLPRLVSMLQKAVAGVD